MVDPIPYYLDMEFAKADNVSSRHANESAEVHESARIGESTRIWSFTQIREDVVIGENTIVGSFVYIDSNVQIGNNCKIQSRSLIYDPAQIHDGVFIGPGAVLTNDSYPRAVTREGIIKLNTDWIKVGVIVERGASIGAGAICVAPVRIGEWALIGAGAIVIEDVPAFALVVGNPARQIGWVGHDGFPLEEVSKDLFKCPKTLRMYKFENGRLK
jgi:UDP-2-acetamido-3-amino-2,3-dideoxy-glucuronate N-acetyltransferase